LYLERNIVLVGAVDFMNVQPSACNITLGTTVVTIDFL
jgi:hypothetical protein